MKLNDKTIKRILKKYEDVFDALERYDRTGKLTFQKKKSVIKRKI